MRKVYKYGHMSNKMDKIFEFFIQEPGKEFYVRELSRKVKKSPTTVSKFLKCLEKQKLIKSENKFNHLIFKANQESELFKIKKLEYNLSLLNESGLLDFLKEEYLPDAIVLFGSFAKSENDLRSDVDLLVVSSDKKEIDLSKYERKIRNKVQLFIHSRKEIDELKKKNSELVNSWINGIVLFGFFEVL